MDVALSAYLSKIMDRAKELSPLKNGKMTVELFLLAVLKEKACGLPDSNEGRTIDRILSAHKIDIAKATVILTASVGGNNTDESIANVFFQRRVYQAMNRAAMGGKDELTADVLLMCIMENPPSNIEALIGTQKREEKPTTSTEEFAKKFFARMDALEKKEAEENAKKEEEYEEETSIGDVGMPAAAKAELDAVIAKVKEMREVISSEVLGQEHAINTFLTGYFNSEVLDITDKRRRKPKATFLFAGPPGVGKTKLAEEVASVLGFKHQRFDMSGYSDKEAAMEFCGSDKVYKNAKGGNLTEYVANNPRCVLLFDEIEKAHITIIHLFLQILDAGVVRDSNTDKDVSFKDAILIFTTNAGRGLYEATEMKDFSNLSRKVILKALQQDVNPETKMPFFPGAICSRFASGNVVMFNHIDAYNLRKIADNVLKKQIAGLSEHAGFRVHVDDDVCSALLFAEGSNVDARTIAGRAQSFINEELYELFRLVSSDLVPTSIEQIDSVSVTVDLKGASNEILALFKKDKKAKLLVVGDEATAAQCRAANDTYEVFCASAVSAARAIIKKEDIDAVLIDPRYGIAEEDRATLNADDLQSVGRDCFKSLVEDGSACPIFILEHMKYRFNEEEVNSYIEQGVRSIVPVGQGAKVLSDKIAELVAAVVQEESMLELAKASKVVSYETAQTISPDGKHAQISLFDFKLITAVDAEDMESLGSAATRPNVQWDEIIGAKEAKKELEFFIDYLKNPKKYMGTGLKAPRGVLLHGEPGTGKTMLAKAVATASGVTFIAAEGNQFRKPYLGEGQIAVHDLFAKARKYAPSVLFIDEIDAIAKERSGGAFDNSSEVEATLTAFLTEMDGFKNNTSKPVFVLAATNFEVEPGGPKSLDPALMRRFDRRVYIGLPTKADRIEYLNMRISKTPALCLSEEMVENIALRSTGMSLASLDSVIEYALRSAIREHSTVVTDAIFDEAFETFNYGEAKKWDPKQLECTARHEAGHAFMYYMSGATPAYLTIVARGNHGGYMLRADQEDKGTYKKEELFNSIRTSLAGRAAEIVYYGETEGLSTGASADLANATDLAKRMICSYGMDTEFGMSVITPEELKSGPLQMEVRRVVNKILEEQLQETIRIISENKTKFDALVEALLEKNSMTAEEIEAVLA